MPAVLRHMGTAPPNIYGANEPHSRILARGAGHLSRPARQQKNPVDAPLLGFVVFKGIFLLFFKLIFNKKMADLAGGADGRPFLGFN